MKVTKAKYITILIICILLICVCVVAAKAAAERERGPLPDERAEQTQAPAAETPASAPEPTPEPSPEPTPEPTAEPTPEAAPEPTAAPRPAPVVTKHPTGETAMPGQTVYFIARANNATSISWFIASPDGSEGVNAADIKSKFPNASCTGTSEEMLAISGLDAQMDGWKVICKFTGPGGEAFTEPAIIAVADQSKACRTIDEVLVRILNKKEAGTAGVGLANAALTAQIADYFQDSGISAQEVKNAVERYTQRLNNEHRKTYKEKAEEIVSDFKGIKDDPTSFSGRLDDSGYKAKSFPWDEQRIADCFEALRIK